MERAGFRRANTSSWQPLGRALVEGGNEDELTVVYEDGSLDALPLTELRRLEGLNESDQVAMALSAGRVLDVGCGAGPHLRELHDRGIARRDLVGLDLSLGAVISARSNGRFPVVCGTRSAFAVGTFDTVLLLMNGLGLAGDLRGVLPFLRSLRDLLRPGGQILIESTHLECRPTPEQKRLLELRRQGGRHAGESRQQLIWRDAVGDVFRWIYLGPQDLAALAGEVDLAAHVLFEDGHGTYLTRLIAA